MKRNKKREKDITRDRNELLEVYKINLSDSIDDFRTQYQINVNTNRAYVERILAERSIDPKNKGYFLIARYSLYNPEIFRNIIYDKNFLKKHGVDLNIINDKFDTLYSHSKGESIGMIIHQYEVSLFAEYSTGIEAVTNFCDKHHVPVAIRNALVFYIIYGDHAQYRPPTFIESNIVYGQNFGMPDGYIEIKIFGDTTKKEVMDNWETIEKWKREFCDYKNPRSHPYDADSKILAGKYGVNELADPYDQPQKRIRKSKRSYTEKLKDAKRKDKRRKKRFGLE